MPGSWPGSNGRGVRKGGETRNAEPGVRKAEGKNTELGETRSAEPGVWKAEGKNTELGETRSAERY